MIETLSCAFVFRVFSKSISPDRSSNMPCLPFPASIIDNRQRARTLAFSADIKGILRLIHVNRSWLQSIMRTIWLHIISSRRSFQNTSAKSVAQVCPSDATCKWTFGTGVAKVAAHVGVGGHGEIVSVGKLTGHKVATRIHCAGGAGTGRGGGLVYRRV